MTQVAEIWDVVEPYLAAEGLELDDLELTGQGRGRVLRVTVDGSELDIDRIARLSRSISRVLDNGTELQDSYQLEVSSPGLERKLRRPEHYQKSIDREIVAKVSLGDHNSTVRGVLTGADLETFTVDAEEGPQTVRYEDVITAKTVFRWEKAPKPGH